MAVKRIKSIIAQISIIFSLFLGACYFEFTAITLTTIAQLFLLVFLILIWPLLERTTRRIGIWLGHHLHVPVLLTTPKMQHKFYTIINHNKANAINNSFMEENRLQYLDGLRGWGALTVVVYHVFVMVLRPPGDLHKIFFSIFFMNGMLAVIMFFIISGYALSAIFIKTRNRMVLWRLLIGRYFRLTAPILLTGLLTYGAVQAGWIWSDFWGQGIIAYGSSLVDVLSFAIYEVYADFNYQSSIAPQLWTMHYELEGSFLVIATLFFCGTSRYRLIFYVTAVVWLWNSHQEFFAAFIIGLIFAELRNSLLDIIIRQSAWLLIIIGGIAAIWAPSLPCDYQLIVAGLLVAGFVFSNVGICFLTNKISLFLGKISFSLYLTHILTIQTIGVWLFHAFPNQSVAEAMVIDSIIVMIAVIVGGLTVGVDRAGIRLGKAVSALVTDSKMLGRRRPPSWEHNALSHSVFAESPAG